VQTEQKATAGADKKWEHVDVIKLHNCFASISTANLLN